MPASNMQVTTENPSYDDKTRKFQQRIILKSEYDIDPAMIEQALDSVLDLFKMSLAANSLDDFAWPPDRVDARPSKDFKTATFSLSTRAAKKSPIVVN